MKLRIRGNSIHFAVSKTELAKLADRGAIEDVVRFTSDLGLTYGIEVRASGAITAAFDGNSVRIALPRPLLELWSRPEQVSVEGSQPIGRGKALQIVLEKDGAGRGQRDGDPAASA